MRHRKPLPVLLVILLDLLGIGAMLGVFSLFLFVVRPGSIQPQQSIVFGATPTPAAETTVLPEATAQNNATPTVSPTPEPTPTPEPGDFTASFPTGEINAEGALGSYQDDNLRIVVTERRTDDAVYFVADVWIRNIREYKTAFAGGEFQGGYALPNDIANDHGAVLALSGDCYQTPKTGIVIRNGTFYRDTVSADVCILYTDGVMESSYESEFNLESAIARGAYQGWSFGPKLIDNGQIPSGYNTTDKIISHNPRAAIGYFEPGHYCFVTVDGRQGDYSRGLTLEELSQAMIDLGCKDAYNLDGGQSSMMVFKGEIVGQPYNGGRDISDIIYFGGDYPQ
jgi:exopolysaccharide biosynthesis protein